MEIFRLHYQSNTRFANTRAIAKLLKELRSQGETIEDEDLAKISPLSFRRIIHNGTYHFK